MLTECTEREEGKTRQNFFLRAVLGRMGSKPSSTMHTPGEKTTRENQDELRREGKRWTGRGMSSCMVTLGLPAENGRSFFPRMTLQTAPPE